MEYYLVRLSYTAAAWEELLQKTTSLDERLEPVRRLIRHLGGSLASFGFFDTPAYRRKGQDGSQKVVVKAKFVLFGEHDLLTILAMPDRSAARAFSMAVAAEPGLKAIELSPMITLEEGIRAMGAARQAVEATKYFAPGRNAQAARRG